MGMRQNIKLEYSNSDAKYPETKKEVNVIYIYSHWQGDKEYKDSELAGRLKKALERRQRWDDESYLARIIVSEVIRNALDDETGYGIQPYEVDPEYPTIVVNLENQTVNGMTYDEFINSF